MGVYIHEGMVCLRFEDSAFLHHALDNALDDVTEDDKAAAGDGMWRR
jgi:hypothetical protein